MADFPADVITNIFSRLPVKSLLQFRSISKSCRFLIDSDHFKTLHFNNLHKSNSKLVLCDYYRLYTRLYAVDLPTLGNAVHLNKPLKFSETYIRIIGSCNGLLCINSDDIVIIWNPYLCKHWIIPCPPSISHFVFVCVYGFGFDSFTGDYKLLKVTYFNRGHDFVSNVSLFSCKTNTWKTLPNMPLPYVLSRSYWSVNMGVFVDHALHWVVTKTRQYDCPKLIVAFDLRFEVFNEVPLPDLGQCFEIEVSQLRGCLSMVVDYYYYSRIDFWVMKQYGSKDGWFKLFTSMDYPELSGPSKFVKPLGYFSDGMKVLFQQDRHKLIWYNFKSKQVSHVTNLGMPRFDEAIIWVESFVQPPFPTEYYRKQ